MSNSSLLNVLAAEEQIFQNVIHIFSLVCFISSVKVVTGLGILQAHQNTKESQSLLQTTERQRSEKWINLSLPKRGKLKRKEPPQTEKAKRRGVLNMQHKPKVVESKQGRKEKIFEMVMTFGVNIFPSLLLKGSFFSPFSKWVLYPYSAGKLNRILASAFQVLGIWCKFR